MSDVEILKYAPDAITLDRRMYEHAIDKGMTFSQYLTDMTTGAGQKDGLDGFELQLQRYGIRLADDPAAGIPATKVDYFFQSNQAPTTILFPEVINRMARVALMDETDILSELVARMETIGDSAVLRALYIDKTAAQQTMGRVPEMGEFPTTTITWSEKATTLKKFGIRIKASYEFMRRASLPLLQILIGGIVLETRQDEVGMAVTALLLGDGSGHASGGAISHTHLSAYQGGTPASFSEMTLKGYLSWLAIFYPGLCTTIIAAAYDAMDAALIAAPTTIPLWLNTLIDKGGLGGTPVIVNNPLGQNVRFVSYDGTSDGSTAIITARSLIGIDKRYAMIGYREVGTDLTETDKIINGQYTDIVMSNTVGFQMIFAAARKELMAAN